MFKILLFLICLIPLQLNAKTEIDKAFKLVNVTQIKNFTLYSPEIYYNSKIKENQIFCGFGCNGQNISPKLVWKKPPVNTKSFAITMYDKNAKSDSGWWHWIVYNIPANARHLDSGASDNRDLLPDNAIEVLNDYGIKGYGGICQHDNLKHNYIIKIYALDVEELDLPEKVMPAMVSYHINKHKIDEAEIHAFYQKDFKVKKVTSGNLNKDKRITSNKLKKVYILNKGKSFYYKLNKK